MIFSLSTITSILMLSTTITAQPMLAENHKRQLAHLHHKRNHRVTVTKTITHWKTEIETCYPTPSSIPKELPVNDESPSENDAYPTSVPVADVGQNANAIIAQDAALDQAVPDTQQVAPPADPAPVAPVAAVASVADVSTTQSTAPAADVAPAKSAQSSGGKIYTGELTFYDPGLGACGETSADGDAICAIDHAMYEEMSHSANPNECTACHMKIKLWRAGQKDKATTCTVLDKCPGCAPGDLDVDLTTFLKLADKDEGRCNIEWEWA